MFTAYTPKCHTQSTNTKSYKASPYNTTVYICVLINDMCPCPNKWYRRPTCAFGTALTWDFNWVLAWSKAFLFRGGNHSSLQIKWIFGYIIYRGEVYTLKLISILPTISFDLSEYNYSPSNGKLYKDFEGRTILVHYRTLSPCEHSLKS